MTRQHYQMFADVVLEVRDGYLNPVAEGPTQDAQEVLTRLVNALIPVLKADNPKFNASTFRAASGTPQC